MTASSIALSLLLMGVAQQGQRHRCVDALRPVRLRRMEESTTWPTYSPSSSSASSAGDVADVVGGIGAVGAGGVRIPCLTASECKSKYDVLIASNIIGGYFYTDTTNAAYVDQRVKGCVLKGNNVYFGGSGTIEEMGGELLGEKVRLWCDDTMPDVGAGGGVGGWESMSMPMDVPSMSMLPELLTSEMSMMDVTSMSMMSIPPLVTSEYETLADDATTSCEVGVDADVAKSCPDGEYCSLELGVCNTKMTVYEGICMAMPQVCTLDYNPVCGCDEKTYSNECGSHSSGISVSRMGECEGDVDGGGVVDIADSNGGDGLIDDAGNVTDAISETVTDVQDDATVSMLGNLTNDGGGDVDDASSSTSSGGLGSYVTGRATALVVVIASVVVYCGGP